MMSMQSRRNVPAAPEMAAASAAVAAGGLVWVSALTGTGPDGKLVASEIGPQTTRALARLGENLQAAGSSLSQAVSVSVFLKRSSDFAAMNEAYRAAFGDQPPARTTVVADLGPDTLVAVAAIALPAGAPRETLHPAGWMKSPRPYSYIVRAGDLVFLSGLLSRRGIDDQPVVGPVGLQVRTILDNADVLLKTAGLTLADVVAAKVFLTDESSFNAMNDEYRTYFPSRPPARATAIVGLMSPDVSVEITLVASAAAKEAIGANVNPSLPLSPAIRTGPFVFLSGVLGNTDANATDLAAQTREVMTRSARTLESAGMTFKNVVDNTIYMTDIWQAGAAHKVYAGLFDGDAPARTTVGTGLVVRTGLIEMMMTAVR